MNKTQETAVSPIFSGFSIERPIFATVGRNNDFGSLSHSEHRSQAGHLRYHPRVFFHFSNVEFRLRSQRPDQSHPDIAPSDHFLLCGLFIAQTVFDGNESAGLVPKLLDLDPGLVTRPGRCPDTVQARSVLCCWAERKFGTGTIELSRRPGILQRTDSQSVKRGGSIAKERKLETPGDLFQ